MADKERLIQRYADLLEPEPDADLLVLLAQLDEAAVPFRSLEPSPSLDRAVEQLAAQRSPTAANGKPPVWGPEMLPRQPGAPLNPRPLGDLLEPRTRAWWVRQGLGMVAAVLVVALVAGLLAAVLRDRPHESRVSRTGVQAAQPGQAAPSTSALPAPDASGMHQGLTFEQAQPLAPFTLVKPQWMPPSLQDHGVVVQATPPVVWINGTPGDEANRVEVQSVTLTYGSSDPTQLFGVQLEERRMGPLLPPQGAGVGTATMQTIDGQTLLKTSISNGAGTFWLYQWTTQGTDFGVAAQFAVQRTEQDVEQMIASMIQPVGE